MSALRQTSPGWNVSPLGRNDDRVQLPSYSSAWLTEGPDVLWTRSGFLGSSGSGFGPSAGSGLMYTHNSVWDWSLMKHSPAGEGQYREGISGITRNGAGVALGSVTVVLVDLTRKEIVDTAVSDPTTGVYVLVSPFTGNSVQVMAYKAGTPVYGASNRTTLT